MVPSQRVKPGMPAAVMCKTHWGKVEQDNDRPFSSSPNDDDWPAGLVSGSSFARVGQSWPAQRHVNGDTHSTWWTL
jgi:hypothetical protein